MTLRGISDILAFEGSKAPSGQPYGPSSIKAMLTARGHSDKRDL
jgi:hypothetical protein